MRPTWRNPGGQAGVSGSVSGDKSQHQPTGSDWREQLLTSRLGLSPCRARLTVGLCFGEGRDD